MTTITLSEIDRGLEDLLNRLSPAQLRKAMQEIAKYLRERNLFRITAQQNEDGSRYAPRKNRKVSRKMLIGFKRHISAKVGIDQLSVGIFGSAANLATIHHDGMTDKGIQYPSRQLVTLPDADKEHIRQILLKHIIDG